MSKRLAPYGNENYTGSFATVGAPKAADRLAARIPSREAQAKVGIDKAPRERDQRLVRLAPYGDENFGGSFATVGNIKAADRLAARVPSREAQAKVGDPKAPRESEQRVVRLKAKAS
jgi:hypothetical protein